MATIMLEEYELMKDSKYRMYVAAVDKALKNFEYTSEWADLISALGKLNKVLLSYTKFPVIPRRIKISKRLAQCMHPALPSGVHLKALETYDIIFKCMGTNRLSNELFIYSAGLFPLLGHAAMNIRPTLLTVYETHFVPLRERLRPALSGFLSGVLPGLETGSDHFERTNTLLENVCEGVGPAWFYTCIWQCVHSNGPVRLPAVGYVLAHYSKKLSMENQLFLMGNDIDVMVSGLCAAVQDSSVLVQRSALDLLMVCFPMHNTQLLYADMVRLVTASLSTILRRDMSLNRRLYSWLLNIDTNAIASDTIKKGENHGPNQTIAFDLLTEAIRIILKQSCVEIPLDVKPYRLLTSLFDKPQIGPVILDTILYDVFRALYLSCLNQQKHKNGSVRRVSYNGDLNSLNAKDAVLCKQFVSTSCQELIKNANLLFNTLQSYYIWSYIERLYEKSLKNRRKAPEKVQVNDIGSGEPHLLEICTLTDFLLDIIPIETYTESTMNILPNLFKCMISAMKKHIGLVERCEIAESLDLCTRILRKIQPVTVKQTTKPEIDINPAVSEIVEQEQDKRPDVDVTIKSGLEKSKSDSKINENVNRNELTIENPSRERSNSNQMPMKKKEKSSPRIDKKIRNKKSKSSSKLYDIKREELNESILSEAEKIEVNDVQETAEVITTKTEIKHILDCLDIFKKFYSAFIQNKILKQVDVNLFYESLVCDKEQRTKHLEQLLKDRLNPNLPLACNEFELMSLKASSDNITSSCYDRAMTVASNILLEFSAFPNILCESVSSELPQWLKVLLVCTCWTSCPTDIQITAMNTLLELFSLAKSQNIQKKVGENNVNVVMMGILSISHVEFIEECTSVLEIMSKTLWDLLGVLNNQNQVMVCVTLLYHIHNIFDHRSFVEEVVGQSLVHDATSIEFFKRFSLLWHLGRDLNIKLPALKSSVRNFDRSLLKVLDNLQNPQRTNIRLLTETFLSHSLLRNDVPRLINPILLKLLAPSTARISIRHVNIQDTDSPGDLSTQSDIQKIEEASVKNVYAVSNINGNVMYHVSDDPSPKQSKKKWYLFSKAGKKYTQVVNMTTTITENLGVVTKKNKDFKVEISPSFERSKSNNVKLIINPLSTKEIYPDGVSGSYTKLDLNESRNSSTESLSSMNDLTETSNDSSTKNYLVNLNPNPSYLHQDSGFESLEKRKLLSDKDFAINRNIFEHIEPIYECKAEHKIAKSLSFDEKTNNEKVEHLSLVHSWSYCISDSDKENYSELELSTSAEDFFKDRHHIVVLEVLNDIIDNVCKHQEEKIADVFNRKERPSELDIKPKLPDQTSKNFILYPMHHHICLYYEVFESDQVLYAFRTLKGCLASTPELFIKCLATSGVKDLKSNQILHLLARHRKSIQGTGFSGDISQEQINFYRGYTFLDIILSINLNFIRTFFPALDDARLTPAEIENNFKIQLESLEILEIIINHLITIVSENTKGFAGYIADSLLKCKVQKVLLHCLLTAVRNFDEDLSFAEEVLLFNGFKLYDAHKRVSEHVEAFQIQLLRLVYALIVLENHVFPASESAASVDAKTPGTNGEHLTYTPTILIPQQPMFLTAVMGALRHQNMKCLHQNWTNMITSSLPYFGESLKQISMSVLHQICNNIEKLAESYKSAELAGQLCSDYATTQLESLTVLCHYCLLDSSQTVNQQNVPSSAGSALSNPGEILNNLMNAFFSPMPNSANALTKQNSDFYRSARKTILGHMPRILSSVAKLWQTIVSIEGDYNGVFGNSKIVKQQLLEFLSPIAVHHSASFLAAIAVAWYERRNPFSNVKTVLPEPNGSQSNLVYLISAIRVIPLDNLVQTVTAVIKNPPPTEGLSADICLDVSVLELFYCYMRNASATQLSEAWSSLLALVREGCSLSPPAQFLLAALLHELMIKCCPLEEKKDQRDLQDVTAKLIECVSQVCGSCLEQTTWLRRNLAVKEQDENGVAAIGVVNGSTTDLSIGSGYSVQAQLVLSEILAQILDICFGSSEKDKVTAILTSLMYNIVPYLRTHTLRNMPSFNACSKLLGSLSSYQYTRKAWKKDVFDLLLDNSLFQMDYTCLKYWKMIVDNLMTHDNTTFRDLMSRVSMTQTGSLSLFSSREQEYEQKAQLLKRLAFVIFCSETDQYAKYMPDIQEQLTTSLRLNVPGVQAQVFMCFRVLLIRMSPLHVTSLWPIIISEMLQVFLQIEQELTTDTEEFRNNSSSHIKLLSALDASWATNSSNGLHALGHPHYLRLQLSTAKLLDLALLLPATSLPQFQMYRWAFVGDDGTHMGAPKTPENKFFTPHITRIAKLMDQKFADTLIETLATKPNELLLTVNSVSQLKELHGFFKTLSLCSSRHRTECNGSMSGDQVAHDRHSDKKMAILLEKIDKIIESDFLDKIPR